MVVVVVLPSEPVTAMMGQGQTWKKDLHLGGDDAAPGPGGLQLRHVGPQARGAEDHVLVQVLKIPIAQPQHGSGGLQLLRQSAQLRPVAAVAGCDGDALPQQQTQQRRVADADADNGHGPASQRGDIFLQSHRMNLLIVSDPVIIPHSGAGFNQFPQKSVDFPKRVGYNICASKPDSRGDKAKACS